MAAKWRNHGDPVRSAVASVGIITLNVWRQGSGAFEYEVHVNGTDEPGGDASAPTLEAAKSAAENAAREIAREILRELGDNEKETDR